MARGTFLRVTTLGLVSFLGEAAREHYRAVGEAVGQRVGIRMDELEEPGMQRLAETLPTRGPALVFLCGLPYVRARAADVPIEALAAPVPVGSERPEYASALLLRTGLDARDASDLAGLRLGVNGRDSYSGWILPRAKLAERGLRDAVFANVVETGSHRETLRLLVSCEVDAGPIDSSVLALEARTQPAVAGLRVLERLGPAPSPPVALLRGDPGLARELRAALVGLADDVEGRRALALGLVERFVPVGDADYDRVRETPGAIAR
jgi:ABC-type phosphate/phosphonate transport system substrate-binding protein